MAIDGSKCPEDVNSTDCLLRSLHLLLNDQRKDDDAENKWDPITFAFTLLIGVVAIAFALATILQAVLAAGKGRRKSGQRAIGDWSKNTKKEWSWSDMSFQVTAQTPILRTESLLKQIKQQRILKAVKRWRTTQLDNQSEWPRDLRGDIDSLNFEYIFEDDQHPARTELRRLVLSGHQPLSSPATESVSGSTSLTKAHTPAAAWVGFLEDVGLHQVNLLAIKDGLRSFAADYLPDDLVAAPAYAEVGVILAATTTVGAQLSNFDTTSRFPTIFGRGFQFDFRQHPILGVVGAYSWHEKRDDSFEGPSPEELEVTLRFGRGVVYTTKGHRIFEQLVPRQFDLLNYDDMDQRVLDMSSHKSSVFRLGSARERNMFPNDFVPFLSLFFASTPPHVPAMFPKSIMKLQLSLTTLALNGDYWTKVRLDIQSRIWNMSTTVNGHPEWRKFVWFDFEIPRSSIDDRGFSNLGEISHDAFIRACDVRMEPEVPGASSIFAKDRENAVVAEAEAAIAAAAGASGELEDEAKRITGAATSKARETRELAIIAATKAWEEKRRKFYDQSTRGYLPVLRLCLKLLHSPDDFEQWFSRAHSETRRALRWTTLQQMQQVDKWLNETERVPMVEERARELSIMTETFTRAETMVKTGRLSALGGIVEPCQTVESGMDELDGRQSRLENIATIHHSDLLQTLRALLDDFSPDQETSRLVEKLLRVYDIEDWLDVDFQNEPPIDLDELFLLRSRFEKFRRHGNWLKLLTGYEYDEPYSICMLHRAVDRLAAVVVCNSKEEENWPLWDKFHDCKHEEVKLVDDVIIYRCLMMYILMITAQDSSEIVESGLWEHVVPII